MLKRSALIPSVVLLLVLWQLAAMVVAAPQLPPPTTVVDAFVGQLSKGLVMHFTVSAYRVGLAMILAALIAAPLGLAIGQNERLNRLASPMIYLTYPIPKIVFLPIILLFLGIGDESKIFMIWLILFFQILLVVRDAASAVRPELVHSVRSLGAKHWQLLRYVYFPACLPATLTALRVSTGTAIAVLFLTESFATQAGLGYYIMVESWSRLAYENMYAGVLAMSILGLALYFILDALETRTCAWVNAGR